MHSIRRSPSLLLLRSLLWVAAASTTITTARAGEPVPAGAAAAEAESGSATPAPDPGVEVIVVTGESLPTPREASPTAVSVIDAEELRRGRLMLSLDESMAAVPGVFVQNRYNFEQGLRISIRGFGARAAFGVRGIRLIVDGIPLTLADGQSQAGWIDPAAIERIEVVRGPVSALYGNATGGVINITTDSGETRPTAEAQSTYGSHGLLKHRLRAGGETGSLRYAVNATRMTYTGFRRHSRAESNSLEAKLRLEVDDSSSLTTTIGLLDAPVADNPGGLTREQAEDNPRQAAENSLRFRTGEQARQSRVGLVYEREGESHGIEITGYYLTRSTRTSVPFTVIDLDRVLTGLGLQLRRRDDWTGWRAESLVGVDAQYQADRRRNLVNDGGEPGETLQLSQDEHLAGVGPYAQCVLAYGTRATIVAGGRYDYLRFGVHDLLRSDGDDSGVRRFRAATGRLGIRYSPVRPVSLYGNAAQSFETPTTTELVNRPGGGGGINEVLAPQRSTSFEAGVKLSLRDRASLDAAAFYVLLEDELVPFQDETDRVYYRNSGASHRYGAEAGLQVLVAAGLRMRASYTYLAAVFDRYGKDGADLAGNRVPGLPPHEGALQIEYATPIGLFLGADARYVSSFFVDDENSEHNGAYLLLDARAGLEHAWGPVEAALYLGAQNLTNRPYNHNVRVNAAGGRFYEPGPGINFYGSLLLRYRTAASAAPDAPAGPLAEDPLE